MKTGGRVLGAALAAGLALAALSSSDASAGRAGQASAQTRQTDAPVAGPQEAPAAVTVADFAWLEGRWIGEGPDGATAEIDYLAPEAGVLVGTFRLYRGDQLMVLELITLVDGEDGVELRVRHFDAELTAFEAEHPLTLVLHEARDDLYRFRNVRPGEDPTSSEIRRLGPDRHVSWSRLEHQGEGGATEIAVEYRRVGG